MTLTNISGMTLTNISGMALYALLSIEQLKLKPAENFKLKILYESMIITNKRLEDILDQMFYPVKSFAFSKIS